jgi:HlyD family secretion protein
LTVPIQSVTTREEKDLKEKDEDYAKSAKATKTQATDKKEVKEIVFVVENGKVKAKPVTTGIQDASYIEITAGVNEGESIVKAPFKLISKTLKDGDAVKVVDEKDLFKETEAK